MGEGMDVMLGDILRQQGTTESQFWQANLARISSDALLNCEHVTFNSKVYGT